MTSSPSSSSSSARRRAGAALALVVLASCVHRQKPGPTAHPGRIAVFPVQNASGGAAPIRRLTDALDAALEAAGIAIVPRAELDAVLAENRVRFTGGVDAALGRVLHEELDVTAVLVPTLEQHVAGDPPKVAVAVRLVDLGDPPLVKWAAGVARSGEDAPGLLGLGLVHDVAELERRVLASVAREVARWSVIGAPGELCPADSRFDPRREYRAAVLDDVGRRTVAVLPFENDTKRRGADEVLAAQVIGELARSEAFEVLDPGVVREQLLQNRIVFEGGVSIDRAMTILELLQADLVVSGKVSAWASPSGAREPPAVGFSVYMIDRSTAEVVWSSTSAGSGDDRVFLFGAGRVYSASGLSCRLARGVVHRMVGTRRDRAAYAAADRPVQPVRSRSPGAQVPRSGRGATPRNIDGYWRVDRARSVYRGEPSPGPALTED